jgi:mevalonate kinase
VQDSCHVIAYVEAYIESGMSDFKIILGIIRQVLDKLTSMITIQQAPPNSRCLMLFLTILYHLLALVEVCLPGLAKAKRHGRSARLGSSGSTSSGFGYRGLIFDPEEQALFHTQTLVKEIQEIIGIIMRLKMLSGIGPSHDEVNGTDTATGKARVDCYADLQSRFEVIVATLSHTA